MTKKGKFNLDFSKIKFEINWASGTTIVTLLIAVITFYFNNKSLQGKITDLQSSNGSLNTTVKTLSETVNVLKGSQEITNGAIQAFMQNPPSELKYRLDRLEEVVEQKLNVSVSVNADHTFRNNTPPR